MGHVNVVGVWKRNLMAVTVSGGAHSLVAVLSVWAIDSEHFNLGNGLAQMGKLAFVTVVLGGMISMLHYLERFPIPGWDGRTERRMGERRGEKHYHADKTATHIELEPVRVRQEP